MQYKYYFGTYANGFTLTNPHTEYTAKGKSTVGSGAITLRPWELKHVDSISEGITAQASTIGVPDKPAECTYVFDTGGPVRQFTINGRRYDYEEKVSNLDFIHTQFNAIPMEYYVPFKKGKITSAYYYSVGIEWLTSNMQSTLKGFTFKKVADEYDPSERLPIQQLSDGTYGEEYNVGLLGFQYSFSDAQPGMMEYSLTLVERSTYNLSRIYKEYIPSITRVE